VPSSFAFDDFTPAGGGRVTAVLGPTNTGKTHYALERMLAHRSGMIGLPLRLLAREIYDRIVKARGAHEVALVTGEEKIIPSRPRYWVATVEAMPLERNVEFLAIDEIQLAADPERGRIFTSRLLHARGLSETLFLGSDTMRPVLQRLFANVQYLSRERFSRLTYTGPKKVTRLPRRTAIIAFSADTVYSIAELIRRQRGGAAVVLGSLSPRTRNAQAELYQSGEVDFLVATDAIGMGLNMDIDHVAFAATRKFDGQRPRNLTAAELAQIAGRAGRHIRDGSFGTTADCQGIDEDIVEAIENHQFDPVAALQWRSEQIDLSSLPALHRSLERRPPRRELQRARREADEAALHNLIGREDVRDLAKGGAALATLWELCQIPDFSKVSLDQHGRLLADLYLMLMHDGRVNEAWLAPRINRLDRIDGDFDMIASRIAHIRTWTYLSHRSAWIENAPYWQERARAIEDRLSDALHEKLTQRFVDRRTATLMKRLKDDAPLLAGVNDDGEVIVEGQFIGRLLGFEFIVDPRASGVEAKSLRAAGEKALAPMLAARAAALANAGADELTLGDDGAIWWRSAQVAQLKKGPTLLRPSIIVSGLADISTNMRGRVEDRLTDFFTAKVEALLGPLVMLQAGANSESESGLQGLAKGVAYRVVENFGATSRTQFGDDLKKIDQTERSKLRKLGMRFGEYTLFMPALLKPAPSHLLVLLWALWNDRKLSDTAAPKAGLVSLEMSENLPHAYYYAAGYRPSGKRAVRIDMLERLAGLIRTARGDANMRQGFEATPQMMSLVGCSGEDFEAIMRSLGLRKTMVKRKAEAPAEATPASEAATTAEAPAPETDKPADQQTPDAQTPTLAPTPTPDAEAPLVADPQADAALTPVEAAPAPTVESPTVSEEIAAPAPIVAAESPAPAPQEAETQADASTTQEPAAEKSDPAAPAPEGAATQDVTPEEDEIALWKPAPRKVFTRPKRDAKSTDKPGANRDGKPDARRRGKKPPPGKHQDGKRQSGKHQGGPRPRDNGPMYEPRHRKVADPNSPFAVLAGLKSQLSEPPKEQKAKKPEKTE
jgi:ATP-dependent RNA helicase SUPV3L1/SUV3